METESRRSSSGDRRSRRLAARATADENSGSSPPRPGLSFWNASPLAPRQSLALVEAEGRRFLVATSAEGAPAFYPLDEQAAPVAGCVAVREGLMVALFAAAHCGLRGSGVAFARPECASASFGFHTVDDPFRSHADHAAARDSDVHDAPGAAAGGVSLSAPGAGHADRAVQPNAAGPGPDDDLVSDDAGPHPGRSAGRRALSRRARSRAWTPSTGAPSR